MFCQVFCVQKSDGLQISKLSFLRKNRTTFKNKRVNAQSPGFDLQHEPNLQAHTPASWHSGGGNEADKFKGHFHYIVDSV